MCYMVALRAEITDRRRNTLRGFLIHNGVFIEGPVWKG